MTARFGASSQKADLDIVFGAVQFIGSVRMTATIAFGSALDVDFGSDFPFIAICDAVENVHVSMAVCHLGNFSGGCGRSARGMIMIMLRLFCSRVRALALALVLENKTHVISLVGINAVPYPC